MTEPSTTKKKLGDLLCDIGKYMLTVIPFTYIMADKPAVLYVVISTAVSGVSLILSGLYFISHSGKKVSAGTSKKRRIRVLKNSVFVVEEEKS